MSNRPTLNTLAAMTPAEAVLLSACELALLAEDVAAIESAAKAGKAALLSVARQKYEADLTGHQFGTKRIEAGETVVVLGIPKNVKWDNDALAKVEQDTDEYGKPLWSYMDIERSISEAAYAKLPADIKAKFTDARTVKPGAMTLKFEPAKVAN